MNIKLSIGQCVKAGGMAASAATIINAALFFIGHLMGIFTDNIFIKPGKPLTIADIIMASLLPSLIGSLVFFVVEKFSKNGLKTFTIISAVLVVLSLANPFMGIPGVTLAYGALLDLMHLVVAGALLFFIRKAKSANAL